MLPSIKKLMSAARSMDARSADLAAALDEARKEIVSANDRSGAAGRAYNEGLLDLDDSELHELINARQAAAIQRDRAQVLVNTLEAKLVATQEAEAVAALTAERAAAEKEAVTVSALVRDQYPKLAGALVAVLERMTAADNTASAVNSKLVAAGRHSERVQDVQSRVLPNKPDFNIWGTTRLMEFPGFSPGWFSPTETAGMIVQPARGSSDLFPSPGIGKTIIFGGFASTARDDTK